MPGDLAVYPHVVMVMKVDANNNSADIIHVTSGRDIKKAGEAVQAEHGVNIQNFRGLAKITAAQGYLWSTQ